MMFDNITDFKIDFSTHFHSRNRWLPLLSLTNVERNFLLSGNQLCDNLVTAGITLISRKFANISFQPPSLPTTLLAYTQQPTIHIHHDSHNHFTTTTNLRGNVHLFDSLNKAPTDELLSQIKAIYSPDSSSPTIYQVKMNNKQVGGVDCGLFSLAYALELASGNDPSQIKFDQSAMRQHFLHCLENNEINFFPKFTINIAPQKPSVTEITQNTSKTEKWTTPRHTVKQPALPKKPNFITPNKFEVLQPTRSSYNTRRKNEPTRKSNTQNSPPSRGQTENPKTTYSSENECHKSLIKNLHTR